MVDPVFASAWDQQARQFPATGPDGLTVLTSHPRPDITVHVLLWRSRKGTLAGILYHYPHDIRPAPDAHLDQAIAAQNGGLLERAGNVNVWVHPRRQGRGIGLRLAQEADRRWGPLNLDQQSYTPAGDRLRRRFEEERTCST